MNKKRILFLVGSVYQLFNAITLRLTECTEDSCDLMMNMMTNWEPDMLARLKEKQIFANIFQMDTTVIEERFWKLEVEDRIKNTDDPLLFFDEIPISPVYDEMYVAKEHLSWKMLYRYHVVNGKYPRVVMFEEGTRSYTLNLKQTDSHPYLQGEYAAAPFVNAVDTYYLYQPELYSLTGYHYELRKIPNPAEHPQVRTALMDIFGYEDMPAEQYVYLEDFFFADHYITNDFDLFKQVAELVGRENIIVKRHPRDQYDRFELWGYKTVSKSVVPWEIQLLANDLREKVLISISSTSILTPFVIFESDMHVISLEKMFVGENPVHQDHAFRAYFNKIKDMINETEIHFHTPASLDELKCVLRYIRLAQREKAGSLAGSNE